MGFKLQNNIYIIEEFEKFGIEAGFGTKSFSLSELKKYAEKNDKRVVTGVQTHSSNIAVIKKGDRFQNGELSFPNTDGLITDDSALFLYTKHADCQGIYFYDTEKKVIGICHSGWKGSFCEISLEMIKLFKKEFKSDVKDMIVAVGIGICASNYEVSKEFVESFSEKFGEGIVEKAFMRRGGKVFFDNERFNIELLKKQGIKEENITVSNQCTYENKELHSYRRDKENSGRNFAFIQIITKG